jgi:hypothetical protein
MKKVLFLFFLCVQLVGHAQPRVLLMDGKRLAEMKTKLLQKDGKVVSLVDSLTKRADGLLMMNPVSVMDKEFTPVSGNKHDYMSQAPYFWYDSSKPNGRPYMRRDGEHNPEIKKITDRTYIGNLETSTKTLALAYYFTGNEKYAAKVSELTKHWFLDVKTKMNPNLDYAQGIPGINNGRGIGIIESRTLTGVADAIGLIEHSASWSVEDQISLIKWYKDYLDWLLTSKNGKEEHAAKNNHGTWYYVQVIDFAVFTGNKQKAKELAIESKKLLDSQLTAKGQFPLELERTNALGYSTFNTAAWLQVATLAEKTGVDLWHFTTSQKASLKTAIDWLMPYSLSEKKWNYKQIGPYNSADLYPVLATAAKKYHDRKYEEKSSLLVNKVDPVQQIIY